MEPSQVQLSSSEFGKSLGYPIGGQIRRTIKDAREIHDESARHRAMPEDEEQLIRLEFGWDDYVFKERVKSEDVSETRKRS
jgi:hypothetical protein